MALPCLALARAWRLAPEGRGEFHGERGALFLESPADPGLFVELLDHSAADGALLPPLREHRVIAAEGASSDGRALLLHSAVSGSHTLLGPECFADAGRGGGDLGGGSAESMLPLLQRPQPQGHSAGGWCDELHVELWRDFALQGRAPSGPLELVYINLARREDRRAGMEEALSGCGCRVRRFEAVSPPLEETGGQADRAGEVGPVLAAFLERSGAPVLHPSVVAMPVRRRRGCIGCSLSHLALYRQLLREGGGGISGGGSLALVLEDDVRFSVPCAEVVAWVLRFARLFPFPWDTLRIDCSPSNRKDEIARFDGLPVFHVRRLKGKGNYWGTHCTLVRTDRLRRMVAHLEAHALQDFDVSMMAGSEQLACLVVNPGFCRQGKKLKSDNLGCQ